MERLTDKDERGNAYVIGLPSVFVPAAVNRMVAPCIDRLAAYEDTGLTPTDISDLRNELCLKCGKYKTAHEGSCDWCRWKKGE